MLTNIVFSLEMKKCVATVLYHFTAVKREKDIARQELEEFH